MKTGSNPLRVAALLLFPLLLPVGSVTAGTIFDNGAADGIAAVGSSTSALANNQAADDFVLAPGSATITDIHWAGTYLPNNGTPDTDDFSISIFEDDGTGTAPQDNSLVDAVLGTVTRSPNGTVNTILAAYAYSVDIDPIPLTAGVTYWLSIVNNTSFNNNGFQWGWATSSTGLLANAANRGTSPLTAWSDAGVQLAFSLTDDNLPVGGAPLPGSLLLMVPGLLLLRRYSMR